MTIEQITEELRKLYPKAVAVSLFVSRNGYEVKERMEYRTPGASWTCLDGSQAPEREERNLRND